jgi:hypothetical protein
MSRKPIQLEIRGLKTPRERVWEAILKLSSKPFDGIFDKLLVQEHCVPLVPYTLVDGYLDALAVAGYIKKASGDELFVTAKFRLVKRQGLAPRLTRKGQKVTQGAGTEAMWCAMKVLKSFDYLDIAKAASLGDFVVQPLTAKKYVNHLGRAGYLTTVKASKPGTPARHRLSKNTGMHAPAITRMKMVFDRNTGEFAALQTPQEVCDGLE